MLVVCVCFVLVNISVKENSNRVFLLSQSRLSAYDTFASRVSVFLRFLAISPGPFVRHPPLLLGRRICGDERILLNLPG